jgi:hypothetical protein
MVSLSIIHVARQWLSLNSISADEQKLAGLYHREFAQAEGRKNGIAEETNECQGVLLN